MENLNDYIKVSFHQAEEIKRLGHMDCRVGEGREDYGGEEESRREVSFR